MSGRSIRVGIDVGGTFTDFVAVVGRGGRVHNLKEASTPEDPSRAVENGLRRLLAELGAEPADVVSIAHGTTIGLNAILQGTGAPIALVISRGHRDVLELTRRLPKEFDLRQPRIPSLVPRDRIVEIDARLGARGEVLAAPGDAELARVAGAVRATGAGAAAVTILHSYLDEDFEAEVAARLAALLPGVDVTASSAIWPEIREYNRASAVSLNATISPLVGAYLDRLQERITGLGIGAVLSITASNGGSVDLATARDRPIDTILSGPASGVTASLQVAESNAVDTLISFDMGGTSSDIAVIVGGTPEFTGRTEVGGIPLTLPVVDVNAIGAGGGSIARVDELGALHVGPESSGAVPGPAGYGRGGTLPTVTDAYLVTGVIDPDRFAGGGQRLNLAAAHRAFRPLAARLGHTGPDATTRAAADVLAVATVSMASELQKVLARRGLDTGEATLLPFGGAGPTHAALLAQDAGISSVLLPLAAGTFCARGAVAAPLRRDYLHGVGRVLDDAVAARAVRHLRDLFATGRAWAASQSTATAVAVTGALEMRYVGQAFELEVALDEAGLAAGAGPGAVWPDAAWIEEAFHRRHEEEFGFRDTTSGVIVVAAKVTAIGEVPALPAGSLPDGGATAADASAERRPVYLDGAWREARVLGAGDLGSGMHVPGPAVVDLAHTTVLVPPGWTLTAARGENLAMTLEEEAA